MVVVAVVVLVEHFSKRVNIMLY